MGSLEYYRKKVHSLTVSKGWSLDWTWLVTGLVSEIGELVDSILAQRDGNKIREEFADTMHFLLELMTVTAGEGMTLDQALTLKINRNRRSRKKTIDDLGKAVRR